VPGAAAISISGGLTELSKTVLVNAPASHNIALFLMPSGVAACSADTVKTGSPVNLSTTTATVTTYPLPSTTPPFAVGLAQALVKDEHLCAEDLGATPTSTSAAPTPTWSAVATVGAAMATPTVPKLESKLVAGSSTVLVQGSSGDNVSVYQLDPGFAVNQPCATVDPSRMTLMQIVVSGSTTPTTTAFPLTASSVTSLTLNQPLVGGTSICIAETENGYGTQWSGNSIAVTDPDDFGRFRTYFIFGIQASNQLSTGSSSSTTAGEYLEGGFNSAWLRARDKWDEHNLKTPGVPSTNPPHWQSPGISTNFDIRLSPIPVAATQTSSTSTVSTPTPTTSTIPNSLSSQQAVRFVGSFYFPWKLTSWNNHTDFFTIGPLVRGGFGTLINPTSSSSTTTGTTTSTAVVTTQFSSAYDFDAFGARFAWDRYTPNTDEGPQTLTQFLITFGNYSNLPSYVCVPISNASLYNSMPSVTTACNQGKYTPVTPTNPATNLYNYSRSVIPRVDIEGFAKLPGYNFVLGLDANLQQYSVWSKSNLDYLNKPGNDIRIFVGISIDLSTLFTSKLGFSGP
jgi:hypothetical protein